MTRAGLIAACTDSEDSARHSRLFVRRLLKWGRQNRRRFPWRDERDPFRILVAELMLQRSRGRTVATVYRALFKRWRTVRSLARANEAAIAAVIRPIGLTSRAATIRKLAQEVERRGNVPSDVQELMELPGVGRYAASATAAVAFGRQVPTVDGVSARVYRRYFGHFSGRAPVADEGLWDLVAQVTPRRAVREWNWAVLDLAASVCLPKVPRCLECPLNDACVSSRTRNVSHPVPRLAEERMTGL